MRTLQVISISHDHVSTEERIALNLSDDKWDSLLSFLKYNLGALGYVKMATCNRIEIYYECAEDVRSQLFEKWLTLAEMDSTFDRKKLITYIGSATSMKYLLELSIGIKSAILGDDQILSQIKKAFEESRSSRTLSTLLERAYQAVMRFHKQVCRDTEFRSQTVSLAYQALKATKTKFNNELKYKSVLIIGAGDMASQVAKYLPKFTFGSISIVNRTEAKARVLAKNKDIKVATYDSLVNIYDIVISCSKSGMELSNKFNLTPQLFIDLSVQSSYTANLACDHIILEELQEKINLQNQRRMSCLDKVLDILEVHHKVFVTWVAAWTIRQGESIRATI